MPALGARILARSSAPPGSEAASVRSGLCCKQYGAASELASTRFWKHVWLSCWRNKAAACSWWSVVRSVAAYALQRSRAAGESRRLPKAVIWPVGVALKREHVTILCGAQRAQRASDALPPGHNITGFSALSFYRRAGGDYVLECCPLSTDAETATGEERSSLLAVYSPRFIFSFQA